MAYRNQLSAKRMKEEEEKKAKGLMIPLAMMPPTRFGDPPTLHLARARMASEGYPSAQIAMNDMKLRYLYDLNKHKLNRGAKGLTGYGRAWR